MKVDYELANLAASQAGYLSSAQVNLHGLSRHAVAWRLRSGAWIPVRKGLYRVAGVDGDYRAHLRGAMAILPEATISHEAAAEIHEIPYIVRGRAAVTVHASTTHGFPGVQVHRSIDMAADHRRMIDTLWTTTPARTLVDSAAVVHPKAMASALDESLASGLVSIDEVQRVFKDVTRKGRTGCGLIRKLLEQRVGSDLIQATAIERVGMDVFDHGGLPRPIWQYPAPWDPSKRIDFAWPHVCVGCECDSRRWHTRPTTSSGIGSATTSRCSTVGGFSASPGRTSPPGPDSSSPNFEPRSKFDRFCVRKCRLYRLCNPGFREGDPRFCRSRLIASPGWMEMGRPAPRWGG